MSQRQNLNDGGGKPASTTALVLESKPNSPRNLNVSLEGLCPKSPENPAVWESMSEQDKAGYKENIRRFLQQLREGRVASITAMDNITHLRIRFSSEFEQELYLKSNSLKKAKLIAALHERYFAAVSSPADAKKVKDFIARHVNYMGRFMGNFNKIAETAFSDNPGLHAQLIAFSDEFATKFIEQFPMKEIPNPSVCIATHNGGGAHKEIAKNVSEELKTLGVTSQIFNENDAHYQVDSMKRAIGLDYASLWNSVKQKCGDNELYALYKELERAIRLFIEDQRGEIFDQYFNGHDVIYDTVMHAHYIRAYSHFGIQIISQVCDYGQIPDAPGDKTVLPPSMHDFAHDLYTYQLEGCVIVIPDSHTYLMDKGVKVELGESKEQRANHFLVLPYPVGKHWTTPLMRGELQAYRNWLNLGNLDEKLLVMMAGGQGVSGVLEKHLKQVLDEALLNIKQDLATGNTPQKLNIALICGTNETLKAQLNKLFTDYNRQTLETHKIKLSDYINVQTLGYMFNQDVAKLVRSADGYLTKPGGSSSAECLAAGIGNRVFVHCVSTLANELENAEMLKRNGATILTAGTPIYQTMMQSQFSPVLTPPQAEKRVVDFLCEQARAVRDEASTLGQAPVKWTSRSNSSSIAATLSSKVGVNVVKQVKKVV